MTSISFGSKALVGKVTRTGLFTLNVSVLTSKGGRPPAYVLNTDQKNARVGGEATITYRGNTAILQISGINEMQENITLVVSCG